MSLPRINDHRPHYLATVVGPDTIAMADAADCRTYPRPAGLMHDFGDFLRMAHGAMGRPAEAVVAVTGNPDQESAVTHAAARGWQNRTAVRSAWSTYVHDVTGETLHVVDLDHLAAADPSAWLLGHDPAALAVKLAAYHHAIGTAYRATPGVTGCALVRRLAAEAADRKAAVRNSVTAGQPFWRYEGHPAGLAPMGDLKWTADTVPTSGHVVQWDTRAAYLAAASAAMLAWSPLRHTGGRLFDPAAAGYWLVDVSGVAFSALHEGRPFLIDPARINPDGTVWLTTPVMAYLNGHGINPDVIDSWTCDHTGRYLRPWAETIRDGLAAADDPDVSDTLKATYRETVGMLNRPGGSVFRSDWWATIIDLGRVNLIRKMDKTHARTGAYPVRVYVDAVYYQADRLADVAGLAAGLGVDPEGRQIGKLRPVAEWTAAEYAARTRRPSRRRRSIGAR